ncbi:hypothetical protein GB937_001300, partial [Aspergillus fischeri]
HKRRGDTLFWKMCEFCQECNADVSLMIRLKGGQVYIFNSDNQWASSQEDFTLSCAFKDNMARAGRCLSTLNTTY